MSVLAEYLASAPGIAAPAPGGVCETDISGLIAAARSGDRAAFGPLYERYWPRVRAYLRTRLPGAAADVDDLVTEVFVTAMKKAHTFRLYECGAEGFVRWLIGIAHNELRHHWRRKDARREAQMPEWWPDSALAGSDERSPEDVAVDRLEIAALARVWPARRMRALVLQHWVGLECAEVAAALDTSTWAVYSLTRSARRAVQQGPGGRAAAIRPGDSPRCACACGAVLPARRRHGQIYLNPAHRDRAWSKRKRREAQRRYLAGDVAEDPAVDRVLALIEAGAGDGITRKALGRRTRLQSARLDRIAGLLIERGLVSERLEPGSGNRPVTRYLGRLQGGTTANGDGGFE